MPRQSRGRQRILIQHIQNQDDMYATFSKRRQGLYNKASDLSTLCGVDIGVIISSPTGNPYSFFSPTMESVISRYQNPNMDLNDHARFATSHARGQINELNRRLDETRAEHKDEVEREKVLDEKDIARERGWWEEIPVEEMNKEQVEELKKWFDFARSQTTFHKEWLVLSEAGPSSWMFREDS